jgi:hypothetical protein
MSGIMLKMILLFTFIVILICIDIIAFITEDAWLPLNITLCLCLTLISLSCSYQNVKYHLRIHLSHQQKKKLGKEMWNAGVLPCMVGISNKDSKGQTDLNGYGELSSPV